MEDNSVIKTLNRLIEFIRKGNIEKAKIEFDKLFFVKKDFKKIKETIPTIYQFGELFGTSIPYYYFNKINKYLENNENYLLRLIRQEIAYNSEYYNFDVLDKINKTDLEKYPDDPEFLNYRSTIILDNEELGKSRFDSSLKNIELALKKESKNINFLRKKALIYTKLRDYTKAEEIIQHALSFDEENEQLMFDLEYIDTQQAYDKQEKRFKQIEKDVKKMNDSLDKTKYEIVGILG